MPGTVVGVASEKDIVMLDGESAPSDLLTVLAERRVPGKQLHVFADRTTVVISRENLHDEDRLREALSTRVGKTARLIDGLGAVSVVGAGINATYENVRAGTATLAGLGITPAALATSSFRITWMVPRDRTADVVRALHARFIESQRPLLPSE
jgi:aspartate kinase